MTMLRDYFYNLAYFSIKYCDGTRKTSSHSFSFLLDFCSTILDNISMKKIFVLLLMINMFVMSLSFPQSVSFADTEYVTINTSYSYLYKDTARTEHYDFKISGGEKLVLLEENLDYYKISYTYENTEYVGYIPTEIASIYQDDQDEIPVYNGKIIKKTNVYSLEGELIEGVSLDPKHEIYIYEGFDSKKEFTKIKFSLNGKIYIGQVETVNLSPNGINKGVIIAFSIITAIVGVILIMLGFKKKKKWHKLLKNEKK